RWITLLDLAEGKLKNLDRQHDDEWIGGPGIGWGAGNTGWLPDNKRIYFQSEASGYSHLYTLNVLTGERKQLTNGRYEVFGPQPSRDKKHFYFSSSEVHPGERHFYKIPIDGGRAEKITSMTGNNEAILSPDESHIALRYSYSNKPWELFVMKNGAGAEAKQLTNSTTEEFNSYPWRDPRIVAFDTRDGEKAFARLYKPDSLQNNRAAVVFVHGAGYLQNSHKWWSEYFREYMFNNFLSDKGYTVIDIDYRASSGYGKKWRTDIYRNMGGPDLSDQVDGVKYLVEQHNIDPKKIGIYGGSYGGFITLMAMFREPDIFAAGAALRPVTDWAHYNHGYTANILNTPVLDSLAYKKSSPIYYAEGLKGALLICHGVVDDNVHFQDAVRLTQKLIELGKENWELAIYPAESHGFKEPSSWTDEYKRIFKLFEQNLNKK
ncbi:MAG: alpha/beta fold hydrolase, partial [Melioribacteraceae bacterium]